MGRESCHYLIYRMGCFLALDSKFSPDDFFLFLFWRFEEYIFGIFYDLREVDGLDLLCEVLSDVLCVHTSHSNCERYDILSLYTRSRVIEESTRKGQESYYNDSE